MAATDVGVPAAVNVAKAAVTSPNSTPKPAATGATWNKDFDNDIEFVTGNEWKAGNLSYHLKSRPKWEGFTNNKILDNASQFVCVDDICLGRY